MFEAEDASHIARRGPGVLARVRTRSPQWEGGGIVFGPHPRSYRIEMPRKQRRLALRSALSAKAQDGGLLVLESFELEAPRTRAVAELIRSVDGPRRVLVVLGSHNEMLEKSARNIPEVRLTLAGNLSVRDIIGADTVIVTRDAIEHIEEAFA